MLLTSRLSLSLSSRPLGAHNEIIRHRVKQIATRQTALSMTPRRSSALHGFASLGLASTARPRLNLTDVFNCAMSDVLTWTHRVCMCVCVCCHLAGESMNWLGGGIVTWPDDTNGCCCGHQGSTLINHTRRIPACHFIARCTSSLLFRIILLLFYYINHYISTFSWQSCGLCESQLINLLFDYVLRRKKMYTGNLSIGFQNDER